MTSLGVRGPNGAGAGNGAAAADVRKHYMVAERSFDIARDLGISPVTVTIGDPACNQVIVRNVPVGWAKTRTLRVIYDREPCMIDLPPVAACRILFRFMDSQHNWVKGVSLKVESPYAETLKADNFGRVLVRIAAHEELRATAVADSYRPAELRLSCTSDNIRVEQSVTLEKAGN